MKVNVVPPNPQWRAAFESEAKEIAAALGQNVAAIHHIGSTAIPNIYAKPVTDILVAVCEIDDINGRNAAMESLGYEVMGEFGIPGRRYFRKDDDEGIRTHQVHVFEAGSDQVKRHLAFRDYMIAHPKDAQKYSDLKARLAAEHANDPDAYMDGKDAFIKEIDRRATLELYTAAVRSRLQTQVESSCCTIPTVELELSTARNNLIRILQNAYSGEVAAAYAYRGHWRSLKESPEKTQIKKIEEEEWDHRRRVGEWLKKLGAGPRKTREKVFWTIGRTLGVTCHVSGWFMPMYFAGRLESRNSAEYEEAAAFAKELGMDECVGDLLNMARVELDHEIFFRETIKGHRLLPVMKRVFGWS